MLYIYIYIYNVYYVYIYIYRRLLEGRADPGAAGPGGEAALEYVKIVCHHVG